MRWQRARTSPFALLLLRGAHLRRALLYCRAWWAVERRSRAPAPLPQHGARFSSARTPAGGAQGFCVCATARRAAGASRPQYCVSRARPGASRPRYWFLRGANERRADYWRIRRTQRTSLSHPTPLRGAQQAQHTHAIIAARAIGVACHLAARGSVPPMLAHSPHGLQNRRRFRPVSPIFALSPTQVRAQNC